LIDRHAFLAEDARKEGAILDDHVPNEVAIFPLRDRRMDALIADDGIETSHQLFLLLAQIAVLTFKSKSMTILRWAGSTPGGRPQPGLEPPANVKFLGWLVLI
jgi:hypothetical protein